jgi:hypothetical protein
MCLVLPVGIGGAFFNLGLDLQGFQNRMGGIFFSLVFFGFSRYRQLLQPYCGCPSYVEVFALCVHGDNFNYNSSAIESSTDADNIASSTL